MKQLYIFKILGLGFSKQKSTLIQLLLLVIVFNIIDLCFAKIFQLFIDGIKSESIAWGPFVFTLHGSFLSSVIILPIALVILSMFKWWVSYLRTYKQSQLGQASLRSLRTKIYGKINSLSNNFHNKNHSGTLISNIVEDLRFVNQFLESGLFPFFETTFFMLAAFYYLANICWPVALVCFSIQVLVLFFSYFVLTKSYDRMLLTKEEFSGMVENFSENMEGHLVNRSLGLGEEPKEVHFQKIEGLHSSIHKETLWMLVFHQSNVWATYLNIFIGMFLAIYYYQSGWSLSTGMLFTIFYLLYSIIARVRMQTRSIDLFVRSIVTATRLKSLLTSKDEIANDGKDLEIKDGDLKLKNCGFGYNDKKVLHDVNAHIKKGMFTALVGFTGSGKSTLLSLICRHNELKSGEILLNNKNIKKYELVAYRSKIVPVFQDTFIFNATIAANIAFGRPEATLEEITKAAKIACIHKFIKSLPNEYQTEVGERGVSLSGGQKQRIGLARALLMDPEILIMDDCTSALDAQTEANIVHNLSNDREGKTTIFTTQRISSLEIADEILVLDKATIIEQGNFEELFVRGKALYEIFSPFQEKIEEH